MEFEQKNENTKNEKKELNATSAIFQYRMGEARGKAWRNEFPIRANDSSCNVYLVPGWLQLV